MKKMILLTLSLFWGFLILSAQTDPCHNPSFESGFDGYGGESGTFNRFVPAQSCDHITTFSANSPNASSDQDFTIIGGATALDPFITDRPLRRVISGGNSARVNDTYVSFNIDKLTKTFIVPNVPGEDFYRWHYSFALVLENPVGHDGIQPFFQVRVCDAGGCNSVLCLDAEIANNPPPANLGMDVQSTAGTPIVFKDWECNFIDFPAENFGQEVTVEFIASDCGAGAHWGYAYIDALCEPCGPNGSVTLNPIPNHCEAALPLEVSGTLTLPQDGGVSGTVSADDIKLYVAHETEGLVEILENPVLNFPDFTFSLNAANLPFDGCYDFRAEVIFEFAGSPLNAVFSESANPNDNVIQYNDYCSSSAPCECLDPSISLNKRELSTCIPPSVTSFGVFGTYVLPRDPSNTSTGTVQDIVVNLYNATASNTPFSPSDLVLGPIPATITETNRSFVANIDLTALPSGCYHLEVLGDFECNNDPIGASNVSFYDFCYNSAECSDPTLTIDPFDGECVNLAEEDFKITGSYTLPVVAGYTGELNEIFFRISGGSPFMNFNIPVTEIDYDNQTFCLNLTAADLPGLEEACMSVFAFAHFVALENDFRVSQFFNGPDGICFSECCGYSIEGEGYCSMSPCDDYAEYAWIRVNKPPSCGPGGYVRVTFLTPGEFYNLNTGNTSTTSTTSMNNYNFLNYYGSFFKPIHDLNGDEPNCYLVEVFTSNNVLVQTEHLCFDIECDRAGLRTLSDRVNCHPDIPEGPARGRLTFNPTSVTGQVWASYQQTDDQGGVCTYVKVKTSPSRDCCNERESDATEGGTEFCLLVDSNPFLIDLGAWSAQCANMTVYQQMDDSEIELVADGCYAFGDKPYRSSISNNPATGQLLWIDFETNIPVEETCQYTIVNELGQHYLKGSIKNLSNPNIDISALPDGIYILNLEFTQQKQQENVLFIRQR